MNNLIVNGKLFIGGTKAAFVCDMLRNCNEECGPCHHTTDIEHAENFEIFRDADTGEVIGIMEGR